MTFNAAVQYIESIGLSVVQVPRKQRYVIRTAQGKSVSCAPLSPHTVVANAMAWQKNPDLRPTDIVPRQQYK